MDRFNCQRRNRYLEAIDTLREIGLGSDISLPQLVVVGDQSSGKSSLLEGLTSFTFPVDSDICTRFATQIILKRVPAEHGSALVSILPGPNNVDDEQHKAHLESFKKEMNPNEFDGTKIAQILGEISGHLGLPKAGEKVNGSNVYSKRFSDDIVRIEICSPSCAHLSIVDVPGLFHNPTRFQTAQDKKIIRDIVKKYINDQRTIILAVCSASSNIANQEVFQLAREADADGKRTVGIITKCDLVPKGDEEAAMKIALNEYEKLALGWFTVKNRSTQDIRDGITIEMRHDRERAFFDKSPWSILPKDRCGIDALTPFLGRLQAEHIRKEFPSLVKDIQAQLEAATHELAKLGEARQTSIEQRKFLTAIATKYQRGVDDALCGQYWPMRNGSLKLRKRLRDLDDKLAESMQKKGHTHAFATSDNKIDKDFPEPSKRQQSNANANGPQKLRIYEWIRETYYDCRGPELPGLIPPHVLQLIFRQQSTKWKEIAHGYFDDTVAVLENFEEALLDVLVADDTVRDNVTNFLQYYQGDVFQVAREHVSKFVTDESENILKTADSGFADAVQTIRQQRAEHVLSNFGPWEGNRSAITTAIVNAMSSNNREYQIYEIHDYLKAYYIIARKRFIDNIANSVIERELLGADGPLRVFTPALIGGLSDDELANIAAESPSTSVTREEYKGKVNRLKKALEATRKVGG